MASQLNLIKIGGNVINDPDQLANFLRDFSKLKGPKVLVHGGGRKASTLLKQMNIEPRMVAGRRITDEKTLEVVTMVYAGLLNKNIVAQLQSMGCMALGLSGADLNAIKAQKRVVKDIDYGFAGDIDQVNATVIARLLESDFTPVFCAITHNQQGQLLNTNADTIASALAVGLAQHYDIKLWYCFEKNGVLMDAADDYSVIERLDKQRYRDFTASEVIHSGMIPKIDNAFRALESGVHEVWICGVEALKPEYPVKGTRLVL